MSAPEAKPSVYGYRIFRVVVEERRRAVIEVVARNSEDAARQAEADAESADWLDACAPAAAVEVTEITPAAVRESDPTLS